MSDIVTPDDSVYCQLCDPPYETSIAMIARHMETEHGIDPQDIADAEVIYRDETALTESGSVVRAETQSENVRANVKRVRSKLAKAVDRPLTLNEKRFATAALDALAGELETVRAALAPIRELAFAADHAWPSNHAHYMPQPCGEILTEWLYPIAEGVVKACAALSVVRQEEPPPEEEVL